MALNNLMICRKTKPKHIYCLQAYIHIHTDTLTSTHIYIIVPYVVLIVLHFVVIFLNIDVLYVEVKETENYFLKWP